VITDHRLLITGVNMLSLKLAFKNLTGAGLRTWLNVTVLSLAFIVIIFHTGIIDGWNEQARKDTIEWEVGTGQLWHPEFDRYDPLTLQDAHAKINPRVENLIQEGLLTPLLITQAAIYPNGRMQNVLLKGIDPDQTIVELPSSYLAEHNHNIPAIIGKRMAGSTRLKEGDNVLVRWRDKYGAFDAREAKIVHIFNTNVSSIDNGQLWIPLDILHEITGLNNEATILIAGEGYEGGNIDLWQFKNLSFLLKDLDDIIQSKKGGGAVLYGLLLLISLLAIFDTQVLSIFRRQKEIGTYIALGMTRSQVIKLFTVEGGAHSIFAVLLGLLYGTPLMIYLSEVGMAMPQASQDMGLTLGESIIPVFSIGLIVSTTLLVVISAAIVSYFPARRISKMKPTDAIRGKLQ
jgi:putative ABC transport system permease protein